MGALERMRARAKRCKSAYADALNAAMSILPPDSEEHGSRVFGDMTFLVRSRGRRPAQQSRLDYSQLLIAMSGLPQEGRFNL